MGMVTVMVTEMGIVPVMEDKTLLTKKRLALLAKTLFYDIFFSK
jgi:hypothetical protein